MKVNLIPLKDDFYQYQADVIPEDEMIAKIMREVEDRRYSLLAFDHLTQEENRKLNRYELIQFFKAYKYPIIHVILERPSENQNQVSIGYVAPTPPEANIRFQQVGQAQLWYSTTSRQCILWECLVYSIHPEVKAQIEKVWRWLLTYIKQLGMKEVLTHDWDPAYEPREDYVKLLKSLGFNYTGKPRIMLKQNDGVEDEE